MEDPTSRLFELCDHDHKGYLTRDDLKVACPQLTPDEITFIFSCLDTDNSGVIEKSEFCAGFQETLSKGLSQGFDGIHEHVATEGGEGNGKKHALGVPASIQVFGDGGVEELLTGRFEGMDSDEGPTTTENSYLGGGGLHGVSAYHYKRAPKYQKERNKLEKLDEDREVEDLSASGSGKESGKIQRQSHQPPTNRYRPQNFDRKYSHPTASPLTLAEDIPCKNEVLQLYEELQNSGVPQIMSKFEEVVGTLCREIGQREKENQHLQSMQKAERDIYHKRMSEIEHEIDQQLLLAERRAREEERQRLQKEKEELKERLEAEMHDLQANIEHLQKMEKALKKESANQKNSSTAPDVKLKMDEIAKENRVLKNNLADNHLEMTLIKAELAELKSQYECREAEIVNENELLIANADETENIQRQLHLLYDANKRLHETNDNLRGALEQRTTILRQMSLAQGVGATGPQLSLTKRQPSFSALPITTHIQQPHSSAFHSPAGSTSPLSQHLLAPCGHQSPSSAMTDNDEDKDSGYPPQCGSSATSVSDVDLFRCASVDTSKESCTYTRNSASVQTSSTLVEFSGPPDRTFRVVMCGDSAVGKSSIIMRIVKGVYQSKIASTLGVDFNVKSIKMDKTNVAIQLWDTAGQERFRSLCNSYFRRADGAILVYDCSSERTFLRIRDWIETVRESVCKPIPVLLVGNKIDLRRKHEEAIEMAASDNNHQPSGPSPLPSPKDGESLAQIFSNGEMRPGLDPSQPESPNYHRQGFPMSVANMHHPNQQLTPTVNYVSTKDGENLAKTLETEFIECSALDGTNVEAALLLLVAEMMKYEDQQMKDTALILAATKKTKKSSCFSCRNS